MAVELDPNAEKTEAQAHGPSCIAISRGDNAPNMVPNTNFSDPHGRILSPHWSVPPGRHKYEYPLSMDKETIPADDQFIHAVWSHVHPACTNTSLLSCDGNKRETVFKVNVETKFSSGPELKRIQEVLSTKGIPIKAGKNFVLTATYENPENKPLDSMVALGVFCESKSFKKPDWINAATISSSADSKKSAGDNCSDIYCGIKPSKKSANGAD